MEINKVYLGDCLEGLGDIETESVDLIVTDPPYYIFTLLEEDAHDQAFRKPFFHEFDHFESMEHYQQFMTTVLKELKRILRPKGQIYMFCSYLHLFWLIPKFHEMFNFRRPIIWYKPDVVGLYPNQWGASYEPILWASKKCNDPIHNKKYKSYLKVAPGEQDVISIRTNDNRHEGGGHPTVKPLSLIKKLVIYSSKEGDLVVDPFMGSGTTAVASKQLGRNFLGFEKDKQWHDVCERRLSQKTLGSIFDFGGDENRKS